MPSWSVPSALYLADTTSSQIYLPPPRCLRESHACSEGRTLAGDGGLSAVSGTARAVPRLAPGPLRSRPLGSTTRPGVVVHLVALLPASAPAPPIREPFRPPASELHPRHFTPALRACPPVIGPRACRRVCNSEGHPWSRADGCLGPAKCHLWVPEPTSLGLGCPVCEEEMPICEVAGTDWDCAPGMQQVLTGHW